MPGERHHYVPRFLLKNFTSGKKRQIYVFDKSNDNQFRTNIKNVAAEKGFYDLELDDEVLTLEPGLAHLEGNASGVIKKIARDQTIKSLDEGDVATLSAFMAIQFVRTKEHRKRFEHLGELFAQKLREKGVAEEDIDKHVNSGTGIPEDKLIGFESILSAKGFVPYFLNKVWLLFKTSRRTPFYISDNPLTLHNDIDHGPYGNIGLAVKGIQIYLPISTTLCLCLLCPSIADEFKEAYERIREIDQISPGLADKIVNNAEITESCCEGIINKSPIKVTDDNVTMMNSLQVMHSSRFVYCESDYFGLVTKMIGDSEKFREGLKPTVR